MGLDNAIDIIAEAGTSAVGEIVGASVGLAVAGPAGSVGGAAIGGAVSSVLTHVKDDIMSRMLSKREQMRVQTVANLAVQKIDENLKNGRKPRDDGFFDQDLDGNSPAGEIFEGTLQAAQREYEERKLEYLARLNASIAFDSSISRRMANQLLKLASELTYEQYVILGVIGLSQIEETRGTTLIANRARKTESYKEVYGVANVTIASDIFDLYRKSLLFSDEAILDAAGINPSKLHLGGYGALLFNLMELRDVDFLAEDACVLLDFLFYAAD